MKKIIQRSLAYFLSFIGLMIGFTSKVLAQYGAPVMHFKLLGHVNSVGCEKPVGGLEVTLVNDATGHVSKAYPDSSGNFNFKVIEYYWEYEFTMNLADIDGPDNQGQFVSKSVKFKLDQSTDGISTYYWGNIEHQKPMMISMDFEGENPCHRDTMPESVVESPEHIVREEEIMEMTTQPEFKSEPETVLPENMISDAVVYPNPSSGQFVVEFTITQPSLVKFAIYTISGQLLYIKTVDSDAGRNTVNFHIQNIPSQTIILIVFSEKETHHFRVSLIQ